MGDVFNNRAADLSVFHKQLGAAVSQNDMLQKLTTELSDLNNNLGAHKSTKVGSGDRDDGSDKQTFDSEPKQSAVVVTGWVALAGVGALLLVFVGGSIFAYRRYTGQDKVGQYTMVVKGGDI